MQHVPAPCRNNGQPVQMVSAGCQTASYIQTPNRQAAPLAPSRTPTSPAQRRSCRSSPQLAALLLHSKLELAPCSLTAMRLQELPSTVMQLPLSNGCSSCASRPSRGDDAPQLTKTHRTLHKRWKSAHVENLCAQPVSLCFHVIQRMSIHTPLWIHTIYKL